MLAFCPAKIEDRFFLYAFEYSDEVRFLVVEELPGRWAANLLINHLYQESYKGMSLKEAVESHVGIDDAVWQPIHALPDTFYSENE